MRRAILVRMPPNLSARAHFTGAAPHRAAAGVGVVLRFRTRTPRLGTDHIEDFADLGPALTLPAVAGLGKVLRLLRAGRVAAPRDPLALVGQERRAAQLLERVAGTAVRLELKPRFRMCFVVWTERGIETVDDVSEVKEHPDAYLVLRRGDRLPARFPRATVIRHTTRSERWHEVLDIERG